ncbi:MAG: LysR family transcriptional regulator [Pseudomonadota bacterium]
MDWNKLKTFYNVARFSNISKAANTMNLSQSSVSRQVLALEDRIGRPLFVRAKAGLILTEEGTLLYESTEKMLEEAEKAQSKIAEISKETLGKIKIATTNSLASFWLPQYIPDFLNIYPKIRITIIASDENLNLRTREVDVAIRTYVDNQPTLVQEYLTSFHLGLYASKKYLEEFGMPEKEKDLDNHRLLTFGNHGIHMYGNINWILEVGAHSNTRTPYLSVNSSQGLHIMATKGMGIAALSQEYAQKNSQLIRVLPKLNGPVMKIYYIYSHKFSEIKRIKYFGKFLKEKLITRSI